MRYIHDPVPIALDASVSSPELPSSLRELKPAMSRANYFPRDTKPAQCGLFVATNLTTIKRWKCPARRFHLTLQRRLLPDTCRIGPDLRDMIRMSQRQRLRHQRQAVRRVGKCRTRSAGQPSL